MSHPQQPNLNVGCFIRPPTPLVVGSGENWRLWRLWLQQYEWFEVATQITAKPPHIQVATFMLSIGIEAQIIYNKWDLEPTNVAEIKERFQNYFAELDNFKATFTNTATAGSRKRKLNEVVRISKFEATNEFCLTQIAQYFNILDILNMAATCTRLRNFANEIYFPKATKVVKIRCHKDETFD